MQVLDPKCKKTAQAVSATKQRGHGNNTMYQMDMLRTKMNLLVTSQSSHQGLWRMEIPTRTRKGWLCCEESWMICIGLSIIWERWRT